MPSTWASRKWRRSARNAGVAITTSPIQFGRKTAMFMQIDPPRAALRASAKPQVASGGADLFQQPRRGKTLAKRGEVHAAAVGLDELGAHDALAPIIRALDEHIRTNGLNERQRRRIIEDDHVIDRVESGHNTGPGIDRLQGPTRALQVADAGVAVQADHEQVC